MENDTFKKGQKESAGRRSSARRLCPPDGTQRREGGG